jgi:cytochrome P450
MQDPLFFLFPFLDSKFLWLFPKRKLLHQKLDTFLDMLETIITHKRQDLKQGNVHNDSLEENERDLLTLMIESEMRGEGAMKAEELKVYKDLGWCFYFELINT